MTERTAAARAAQLRLKARISPHMCALRAKQDSDAAPACLRPGETAKRAFAKRAFARVHRLKFYLSSKGKSSTPLIPNGSKEKLKSNARCHNGRYP